MKTDIVFIDQTLSYALENQYVDSSACSHVKEKLAALAPVLFDLTLAAYAVVMHADGMGTENIRVGVRPAADEVDRAYLLGCRQIKMGLSYQEVKTLPAAVKEALRLAEARQMTVALHIAGCCRYSASGLYQIARLVRIYNNITSFVVDDRQGELDPMVTYRTLRSLKREIPCGVEYYGNNSKGLAAGNALSAIRSGIGHIAVACGGVGGYPALEEVLMGARYLLKLPLTVPENMAACCAEILKYVGQRVHTTKPIIGANIFAHESGIHVDGVNKKSDLYEPFTPETVGLPRKIIIGKHSGKAAIEMKLKEMSIVIQPAVVPLILEKARALAIGQKAPVSDQQLQKLVCEAAS
ncbi:hypothetical protein [Sporomusa aerivorans]|uniref:homocitrate synthase/isopropylmalate synthase family protein n=1 Tax=Sporomusa aerivorans TaxID=204936 RepID=UPI00352B0AAB